MKQPLIDCPKCDGKGKIELPEHLAGMLARFKNGRALSTQDLHDPAKCEKTAVNNRLEFLRDLGFLKRERRGRYFFYTRA